jgi:tRNA (mo5U34)-methyltransferase
VAFELLAQVRKESWRTMYEQTTTNVIDRFKPWFHNLHLPSGVQTAPNHPLGDFPTNKWQQVSDHIPLDLSDWNAIDIGCNAGFYSFELARRGAAVTAIDVDGHYLEQACWAARQFGLEDKIVFERMQVYELARLEEQYDLVWFMGVFYHLRYPFLALNIVARKVKRLLVFQTLTMPGELTDGSKVDPELDDRDVLLDEKWPKMAFIEGQLAHDPTNWWVPNQACVESMLRSSGLKVICRPGHEIFICEPAMSPLSELSQHVENEFRAAVGSKTTY